MIGDGPWRLPGDGKLHGRPGVFPGGRFTLGYWLNDEQTLGIDGSCFFLPSQTVRYGARSDASPVILGRPVQIADNGFRQDFEIVAFPGLGFTGGAVVTVGSRIWGADANVRTRLLSGGRGHLDLLGGIRHLGLDDTLQVNENPSLASGSIVLMDGTGFPPETTTFLVQDTFQTRNRFYGGQLGLEGELRRGNLFLNCRGKLALGNVHQSVEINGSTTRMAGGMA